MASKHPADRVLAARLAAHTKWSTTDPVEGTAKARKTFLGRFEREVDPDGVLQPAERARRAEHARKAYFLKLALKSAKARRKGGAPTTDERRSSQAATPASGRTTEAATHENSGAPPGSTSPAIPGGSTNAGSRPAGRGAA